MTSCLAPRSSSTRRLRRAGFVEEIDVRAVGLAVVELGGGRARAADAIDPAVGLTELAAIGAEVGPDARSPASMRATRPKREAAAKRLRAAYRLGEAPLSPRRPGDRARSSGSKL